MFCSNFCSLLLGRKFHIIQYLVFKNCAGSHVGIINSVELIGCYVNGEECEFRRGMYITLIINFTPCEYKNNNVDIDLSFLEAIILSKII